MAWTRSRFELSEFEDRHVDSYPGLEEEFGLPKRVDLDAEPDEVFPLSPAEVRESTPAKKAPASVKKVNEAEEDLVEAG
jgi:hypothetical protein